MIKKISNAQCYLVGCLGKEATFVFKKLSSDGRILPKKYVVQLRPSTQILAWVYTQECFDAVNAALKFFEFGFTLENVVVEWRRDKDKFFFYNVY